LARLTTNCNKGAKQGIVELQDAFREVSCLKTLKKEGKADQRSRVSILVTGAGEVKGSAHKGKSFSCRLFLQAWREDKTGSGMTV
jgi:hypothetical protein